MALGPCVRRAKRRARTAQGAMLLTSVAIERRLTPTAKLGGPRQVPVSDGPPQSLEVCVSLMLSYLRGDGRWREAIAWD